MKIGEIVEALIRVRDRSELTPAEDDAVCAACNILDRLPATMDEDAAKVATRRVSAKDTLTKVEIITKVEHEIKFQRMQAGEYESGVHKDEVIFARYDQAAKILEWVLGLLNGQEEHA